MFKLLSHVMGALLMLQTTNTFICAVVSASAMTSPSCFAVYRCAAAGAATTHSSAVASASASNP